MAYHASGGEVGALLVLLAVSEETIEGPNTVRDEIVGLKEIQVLVRSGQVRSAQRIEGLEEM